MYAKSTKKVKRSADFSLGIAVGAIYARVQDSIDAVAIESGGEISRSHLAAGLADVLRTSAGGELLDRAQRVPKVRRGPAQGHEVASAASKVHVRSRRRASTLKTRGRGLGRHKGMSKRSSKGIKSYWSAMTPEQRSAEMQRRQDVARAKRAA